MGVCVVVRVGVRVAGYASGKMRLSACVSVSVERERELDLDLENS